MSWRRVELGAAILLTCLAMVAVGIYGTVQWNRKHLARLKVEPSAGGMATDVKPAQAYVSMYAGRLCLDRKGPAEIVAVRPRHPVNGAQITGFALVSNDENMAGGLPQRLADVSATRELSRFVAATCAERGPELVVELHRPGAADVSVDGLTVTYRVGGHSRTARLDEFIGMCVRQSSDDKPCLEPDA